MFALSLCKRNDVRWVYLGHAGRLVRPQVCAHIGAALQRHIRRARRHGANIRLAPLLSFSQRSWVRLAVVGRLILFFFFEMKRMLSYTICVCVCARVGGSVPIVWSYFIEFIPKHVRGKMMCCLACSWLIGNLLVVGFAYATLNRPEIAWTFFRGLVRINDWRLFIIVCALPSILTAVLLLFLPESPKFCLYVRKKRNAHRFDDLWFNSFSLVRMDEGPRHAKSCVTFTRSITVACEVSPNWTPKRLAFFQVFFLFYIKKKY